MFCGSQNHSAMPGILRRGGHKCSTEEVRGLCHRVCVCVCVTVVTPFSISAFLCISQAHATDYITCPHPCAAVEQNKGVLPAETQQPRLVRRRESVCLCARGRQRRERYMTM